MAFAFTYSRAAVGVAAPLVTVEAHVAGGLPGFSIVGLPETAVRESKDRVRGAILSSGFEFPRRRIIVSLAPADLPKEGARFDLPIALSILAASHQIPAEPLSDIEIVGELALNGILRPVRGVLATALAARDAMRSLIVPMDNATEAALAALDRAYCAPDLLAVTAYVCRGDPLAAAWAEIDDSAQAAPDEDLADVRGQALAKRALEIAAAGGHSLLMLGPPGTGKTMLAMRLPGLLPPMTEREALESAAVHSMSVTGFDLGIWRQRPFRTPHHSASGAALVGGGAHPRPGEISLAHHGVLFLDELPEFDRRVLEYFREPLESGQVTISRVARQVVFPAAFQLVAAMNPCPCGYFGDSRANCCCTSEQVQRYRSRISGPLLDRIDLHIEVPPVPREVLRNNDARTEPSETVRARVVAARHRQLNRQAVLNKGLKGRALERYCPLAPESQSLLDTAMDRFGLSARSYHRIIRLARTIADLSGGDPIDAGHVAEAVQLRCLDRRMPAG